MKQNKLKVSTSISSSETRKEKDASKFRSLFHPTTDVVSINLLALRLCSWRCQTLLSGVLLMPNRQLVLNWTPFSTDTSGILIMSLILGPILLLSLPVRSTISIVQDRTPGLVLSISLPRIQLKRLKAHGCHNFFLKVSTYQ